MEASTNVQDSDKLFAETYSPGTVVLTYITRLIAPSQVVTTFGQGFIGRISLMDLAWSVPKSEEVFGKFAINDELKCVVTYIDFELRQVFLSRKFLEIPTSQTTEWERVNRGDEYEGEVISLINSTFVYKTTDGMFGLVPKYLHQGTNKGFRVRVSNKSESSNLLNFIPASVFQEIKNEPVHVDAKFAFIEEDLRSYIAFKESILGNNASNTQHELIKSGFEKDDKIFSKEFTSQHTLYIQFESNSKAYDFEFKQAFASLYPNEKFNPVGENAFLNKLSKEKYWIKVNRFKADKSVDKLTYDFSLYNEQINFYGHVGVGAGPEDIKFTIRNFSVGRDYAGTAEKKKNNSKNGSFLLSSAVVVLSPYGSAQIGISQQDLFDSLLLKSNCFYQMNVIRKESGEILRLEGRTLGIIDKFLEYQISLLDKQQEDNIFVETYKQIPSSSGEIAILISLNIERIEIDEGCIVNIRLRQASLKNNFEHELGLLCGAKLSTQGENFTLTFLQEIQLELLNDGFYIDKRISKKQFTIQRSIIKDFLEKKIKIDHIESMLIKRNKMNTPQIPSVKFKNPDLVKTKLDHPDNNQVIAVKKAVGNQNIFLIQGPPGTGKTTVIAEIIQQLTGQGKRILVAGQNHVAVDNVLEKIAKDPALNLLRVGNPDRVDPGLVKYNIDHLVQDYKKDYRLFLSNQALLARTYLELLLAGSVRSEILNVFNKYVQNVSEDYEKLKLVYKERHFVFRDTLASLNGNEIEQAITVLERWIDSIQGEYETLLKPLIYGNVDVVFATCIGIKTDQVFKYSSIKFDTVIIDEAGKSNIAESLVAMELGEKAILVGDQMQLPPYIDSTLIDEKDADSFPRSKFGSNFPVNDIKEALKTSFFEFMINRIDKGEFPKENHELLNYQHRMHPNIGEFISRAFYNGKVQMGSRTFLNRIDLPAPFDKEIIFFDTSNSKNPYEHSDGFSAMNNLEAESIAESILPALFNNSISPQNIAIIAPYKSQVANIKSYINKSTVCTFKTVNVSTLDSFQGMEYDIIIFSFTRSVNYKAVKGPDGKWKSTKVGFLDDARRLNVAFSRAKKKLILIGNSVTLSNRRSHYDGFFDYTQLFKNLISLSKDREIGNFVNITDFNSRAKSQTLWSKYKVGDVVKANVKRVGVDRNNGHIFGLFITIDGHDCLAPKSLNPMLESYTIDQEVNVKIYSIKESEKKITLTIEPENWGNHASKLVIGRYLAGEVLECMSFGYSIRIGPKLVGFLPNSASHKLLVLKKGEIVNVAPKNIDFAAKQIILKA